jgi:hypothetical protein
MISLRSAGPAASLTPSASFILPRLQEAEKALKEAREAEYVNLELAAQEKEAGNAAFKEQK